MPIYEFQCADCGTKKEVLFRSGDDKVEMKCEKCGSENLQRVMSCASFTISGGSSAPKASKQSHQCASGSCTTYDIPGPA